MGTVEQDGVLRVLTFSGTQPFVVRCERETRVKDIVGAIAEIWGFKDAAHLFTLCRPAAGAGDTADVTKLLPGVLLAWNDRPCQSGSSTAGAEEDTDSKGAPPLLLVRSVFGGTPPALEQNQAVLSLTAAQIAADAAAGRYPVPAEASLCQHLVKQGQHTVVLHMASSWAAGACLVVGPALVLSGGASLGLDNEPFNLGINAQGIHIMTPQHHRAHLSMDAISSVTPAGDVLNVSFVSGQADLLLQLPGAEAVAEAFKAHKQVTNQRSGQQPQQPRAEGQPPSSNPMPAGAVAAGRPAAAAGTTPLSASGGALAELGRGLHSGRDGGHPEMAQQQQRLLTAAIQVLRPWEQTPPVLRASLQVEQAEQKLVEAALLVVDEELHAGADAADSQGRQQQQRIKLQLRVVPQPNSPPEPRVKLTLTPVPQEEQERLRAPAGEEQLVRLVLKPSSAAVKGAAGQAGEGLNVLQMAQQRGSGPMPGQQLAHAAGSDAMLLRGSMVTMTGAGQHPPQLLQRLQQQQQQQQEVRQGLLSSTMHMGLGGPSNMAHGGSYPGPPYHAGGGMRPAYGARAPFGSGGGAFRHAMQPTAGMPHQGPAWAQQQQAYSSGVGGMMPRGPAAPAGVGMRPGGSSTLPHQPYALVGPPNTMLAQQHAAQRAGIGSGAAAAGAPSMNPSVQPPQPRPQQMQPRMQAHQPFPPQMSMQQQQQHFRPQQIQQQQHQHQQVQMQPAQQQLVMQPGGYMIVQQGQQMQQMQQQQPAQQVAFSAMQQPQMQQQQQQQMMMMQASGATGTLGGMAGTTGNSMVLVTTADGRQMLLPENQLQWQQQPAPPQQQQHQAIQQGQQATHVLPGVFVLGPHGELIPASQPQSAADSGAGMQQMVLQPQQQMSGQAQQQAQQQPIFIQQTSAQKLQQQFQAQQVQQVHMYQPQPQAQQHQQPLQMQAMANNGFDQLTAIGMSQPQQTQLLQPQTLNLVDLSTGQLQLQPQGQPQQQFVAVSTAMVGGAQGGTLLQLQQPTSTYQQQLQGIGGMSAALATPQGLVLQGQQQGQQQLFMAAAGQHQPQQQQQLVLPAGATLLDGTAGTAFLQQQQQHQQRRSSGANIVTSNVGATTMFSAAGAPGTFIAASGPPSAGAMAGMGFLQQGPAAQGLQGINLGDASLNPGGGISAAGMGGIPAGISGMGGIPAGNAFVGGYDALRGPGSQNSLDNVNLAAAAAADPPGLSFGSSGAPKPGFLQQQQQPQQPQQQVLTLGNAGIANMPGLTMADGLQTGVLSADSYVFANGGMSQGLAGNTGLGAPGFTSQNPHTTFF